MIVSSLTLLPGLLLLLLLSVESKKPEAGVSPEDQGSRLRGLWKLHMRDSLLKAKGSSPPPVKEGVKQQLLYCRVGIGYHLQILPSGSVGGVHKPTEFCWLKVFAMKHGVVGIRGVKSGLYLCMKADGLAYGAEKFSDDCLLKENLEENHYTTYSSVSHPGIYLALSSKGQLRRGNSVGRHQSCTHFLPRKTS
ncbi:fibroblast growth factor 4A [Notolabrus celidotus]|uniref:fibroblast growth factor 4A n=1 Tax=Notolabrus celidotus TaxID=1203425 RepID=UPI0014902602|nr:fibroblast growth factor 4A [Notolabrus celidotus]XP_034550121.1 fibroblast growth factor 4A [Notolabrus celidotus]